MPSLYVANCSKQEHLFTYMIPENPRPFSHKIRAGAQVKIDGSDFDLGKIIEQHAIYGMQIVDKVRKGFGGLAYRLGKPISIEAIESGINQSDQEMINRALETRKNTAAATDQIISNKAQEMGARQIAPLEIEIIEESKGPTDKGGGFNETIQVVKDGLADAPRRRGRPAKR